MAEFLQGLIKSVVKHEISFELTLIVVCRAQREEKET